MSETVYNIDIKVSSRILRHISRGIYRSPAGALKELVSNSYDSGAKKVTINTGYPVIEKLVITDNGKGISFAKFKEIMNQIGFSEKNLGDEIDVVNSTKNIKRKTIGHYGIGFMAIGQLGKKAIITSKLKNELTGIKAILDFEQFETHNAEDGKKITKAKDEALLEAKDKKDQTIAIGTCTLQIVNYNKSFVNESFTKVELSEIREDVKLQISGKKTSKLLDDVKAQEQYSASFQNILKLLRENEKRSGEIKIKNRKVPRLREYFYEMLLWELSAYAPVPYPDFPIFQKGGDLFHFKELADNKDFELIVDGFVLTKPFEKWFFESKENFLYKVYKWEDEIYYMDYKVSAYIIYQPGTMIRPKVQQGILVRENFVAVGLYDKTFLNYPFNEGTKFNSLTGEIYATGLSGAMNIDRDSFNQTAEEYSSLTEWFHGKLYSEVFPDIKRYQKEQESPSRTKSKELVLEILDALKKDSKKIKKVRFKPLGKSEKRRIMISKDTIIFNSNHKDCDMSVAKREKLLFAAALIMKGIINESVFDEISDEIEKYKNQTK